MAIAELTRTSEIVGGPGLSDKDAQLVSALIEGIHREMGHLSTEELLTEVVERSRPKKSETHHLFEWDPAKGHALYLLERARKLVMSVKVIFEEMPKEPVRAYSTIITEGKRGPVATERVLQNRDLMAALLEQAKADLETWSRRYDRLRKVAQLKGVFAAVERATKRGGRGRSSK